MTHTQDQVSNNNDYDVWLLTAAEVARRLSIGRTKTYELISSGALRTVRIGTGRRVPIAALRDYMDRLMAEGRE